MTVDSHSIQSQQTLTSQQTNQNSKQVNDNVVKGGKTRATDGFGGKTHATDVFGLTS